MELPQRLAQRAGNSSSPAHSTVNVMLSSFIVFKHGVGWECPDCTLSFHSLLMEAPRCRKQYDVGTWEIWIPDQIFHQLAMCFGDIEFNLSVPHVLISKIMASGPDLLLKYLWLYWAIKKSIMVSI